MSAFSSPCASTAMRRGAFPVHLAIFLLCALAAASPARAATCQNGRTSPRATSGYLCQGVVLDCDAPVSGFDVKATVYLELRMRRIGGGVVDLENLALPVKTARTSTDGSFVFGFNWCSDVSPSIPDAPAGFVIDVRSELGVEVSDPASGALFWRSERLNLADTNSPRFDHRRLTPDCVVSSSGGLLVSTLPEDLLVVTVPLCPNAPCTKAITYRVEVESAHKVERVGYAIFDAAGDLAFDGLVCRPDPIEGTGCGSVGPGWDVSITSGLTFTAGTWNVLLWGEDEAGEFGSASFTVIAQDSDAEVPGPLEIDSVEPRIIQPVVQIRGGPSARFTPKSTVAIRGENFHPFLSVSLSPETSSLFPTDWVRYPVENLRVENGGRLLAFDVPEIPERVPLSLQGPVLDRNRVAWRVLIHDRFDRPGRVSDIVIPDRTQGTPAPDDYLRLREPGYPVLWGLGFRNEGDDATFDQFLAVYQDNAYLCLGADVLGECLGVKVPDPIYWAGWWWGFKEWMNTGNGTCVGMSATSLLMAQGDLSPQEFDPDAIFPSGILTRGDDAQWDYGLLGKIAGPPRPANLWAHIRMYHGRQASDEFLHEYMDDFEYDGIPTGTDDISGVPSERLEEIRETPLGYLVCMASNDEGGHCVTPYAALPTDQSHLWNVMIYDSNHPRDDGKRIEIDTVRETYDMTHAADYEGNMIGTARKRVFASAAHMPGLGTIGEFLVILVFGEARPLVRDDEGAEWGWREDGSFVGEIDGIRPMTPLHGPTSNSRDPVLRVPADLDPNVEIGTEGGDYFFHAAQRGTIFQVEVEGAREGRSDFARLAHEGDVLRSLRVSPETAPEGVKTRVGVPVGEGASALFVWSGLEFEGGGDYGFTALPERKGVSFDHSGTRRPARFRLVAHTADAASETHGSSVFGPFEVPVGAVHTATFVDWPANTQILSELDVDADGVVDRSEIVTGSPCGDLGESVEDADEDGIPDACGALPTGTTFRRGDANDDGGVDLSDAVSTLAFLFSGAAESPCADAADANDDGQVDISDPIHTLAWLFLGGAPIPAPGAAACGEDPTGDGLGCGRGCR